MLCRSSQVDEPQLGIAERDLCAQPLPGTGGTVSYYCLYSGTEELLEGPYAHFETATSSED